MESLLRLILAVILTSTSRAAVAAAASPRPHIVFIIADDLGWGDVGFHGSEISTPNIDALAHSGIILNNYYVSPICSPTRSAIMTGRHPIHTGMQVGVIGGSTPYGLPLNETIMAQHLQQLNYRRHAVGKWHLGFFSEPYLPTRRGFETFFGYYTGHEDFFDHHANERGYYGLDIHSGNVSAGEEVLWNLNGNFSTEMYTAAAEQIIKEHDPSQPLFLYLAQQAVHAGNGVDPLQAPQKYVDRFKHKIHDVKRRIFAGMVSALDDSVGRVVGALRDRGLLNNTIIVFTTDNGGPTNGYDGNAACNWPLRGVKNTMWEGGVRGVGLINSPLLGNRSYVSENLFHITDWLPTLFRAAGGDPSTLTRLDGHDMLDMLKNKGPAVRTELLHNIDPRANFSAIRVGDYKLVMGRISKNDNSWYPPPSLSDKAKDRGAQLKLRSEEDVFKSVPFGRWGVLPRGGNNHEEQRIREASQLKFSSEREVFMSDQFRRSDLSSDITPSVNSPDDVQHIRGSPIKVECGKKPLNASFNCIPEKAPCLFHIRSDPCEFNNIAGANPSIVAQMLTALEKYRSSMVAPGNKPFDPNANPSLHGGAWVPWIKS